MSSFTYILLFLFCAYSSLTAHQDSICEKVSAYETKGCFRSVKDQVESLWDTFQSNKKCRLFQPGKTDEVLKEEFKEIQCTRKSLWKMPQYALAQHLIADDLIRAPGCVAFAYNNTVPYYNASTISLGDNYYIACEGPRSKDVPSFFRLLATEQVTHLIRLTSAYEGWVKKCHPYWDGNSHEANGEAYLRIPVENGERSIRAFHMDYWRDNQGVDPEELLAMALLVRKELKAENGLLVVHCSAGVGRTGTFLATLAIVDAIDQKEPFSIEEIVYRLSLQRVHSVAKYDQYLTLHRAAEIYLKNQNL